MEEIEEGRRDRERAGREEKGNMGGSERGGGIGVRKESMTLREVGRGGGGGRRNREEWVNNIHTATAITTR